MSEQDLRNTLFRVRGILQSGSNELIGSIVREITEALGDEFPKLERPAERIKRGLAQAIEHSKGQASDEQPDEAPHTTASGKSRYIALTDTLDHAYGQWMNSHGTPRAKRVEEEFLFWCSANLRMFRKEKLAAEPWTYPKGYGPGDPQCVIDEALKRESGTQEKPCVCGSMDSAYCTFSTAPKGCHLRTKVPYGE